MCNSIYRITGTPEDVANLYLQGRDPTAPFAEGVSTHHWWRARDDNTPQYVEDAESMVCHPEKTVPKLVYDPAKLEFLDTVHESASNAVFKVKWEGELRALKVNHLLLSDMQNDVILRERKTWDKIPPWAVHLPDRFANELKAYNRLLQTNTCEKGFVPRPYGWFIFTGFDDPYWQTPQNNSLPASPYDKWLKHFKEDMRSPRALLLEWIDTPRLAAPMITSDQFRCLFKVLEELHRARILHRDVSPRDMFVRGSKIVIADFDVAVITPPDDVVDMVATTMEVQDALCNLFMKEEYMQVQDSG